MGKKVLSSLTALSFFALLIFSVQAQTITKPPKRDPTKVAEHCIRATSKIDAKINKYNASADHTRLLKIQTRLSTLVIKLKTGGYDTATLEADLATLKTKADTCKTAYGQFIAKLGETKNFACGQSQGQFKAALEVAKTQMKSAQTACKDARLFINTVLKPDLKALKEKVKANRQLTPKPTKVPSPSIIPSI